MGERDESPWARAAWASREIVVAGVCGEDRGFGDRPAGCGQPFALRAWSVDVTYLMGVHTMVAHCECGHVCAVRTATDAEARELESKGACPVTLSTPDEAGDPSRMLRRPRWPEAKAAKLAAEVMAEAELGDGLEGELAAWRKEYGL